MTRIPQGKNFISDLNRRFFWRTMQLLIGNGTTLPFFCGSLSTKGGPCRCLKRHKHSQLKAPKKCLSYKTNISSFGGISLRALQRITDPIFAYSAFGQQAELTKDTGPSMTQEVLSLSLCITDMSLNPSTISSSAISARKPLRPFMNSSANIVFALKTPSEEWILWGM